jgi:general secretion pathway protein J
MQLPALVRVTVRDSATGQVLAVSRAATVHINAQAECARAKNATECLTAKLKPDGDKSDKKEQL